MAKLFAAPNGRAGDAAFADKQMYYGHIVEPLSSETVDEVLVVFMRAPHSYTGEDVCEIQCHGGDVPLRRILELVCKQGAVPAQPGEFTKRAFLNGRLDLAQAGAVIDLIKSKTELGYRSAKEQAEGRLSERVRGIRETLLSALAEMAARIDYPEAFEADGAGAPEAAGGAAASAMKRAAGEIEALLKFSGAGRIARDGLRVVIIGKPNAGKSSLFNALAREDAAIVTDAPGTTRDALELWLDVKGVPVLLTDTAGIREGAEKIEALGVERAKEQYRKADASIFLLDGSLPLSEEDFAIARELNPDKKLIVAINKTDLPQAFGREEAAALVPFGYEKEAVVNLSLIGDERGGSADFKGENETCEAGISELEKRVFELALGGAGAGVSLLVTKARHKALFEEALSETKEAMAAALSGAPIEFAETNLRTAWLLLGEIIGDEVTEDVIDRVFEDFCIGK